MILESERLLLVTNWLRGKKLGQSMDWCFLEKKNNRFFIHQSIVPTGSYRAAMESGVVSAFFFQFSAYSKWISLDTRKKIIAVSSVCSRTLLLEQADEIDLVNGRFRASTISSRSVCCNPMLDYCIPLKATNRLTEFISGLAGKGSISPIIVDD